MKDWSTGSVYAFVEFENEQDAEEALYDTNGKSFMGNKIRVEFCRGTKITNRNTPFKAGPPHRTPYRVEVRNLPYKCSWQVLYNDYMRFVGPKRLYARSR